MKQAILTSLLLVASFLGNTVEAQPNEEVPRFGFAEEQGKYYWYENGIRQGVAGDPKNVWDKTFGIERGREIYDPASDGWYWLDASEGGARAQSKEVWMPYLYQQDLETGANSDGKWNRYDSTGKMLKGWLNITGEYAEVYPDQNGNTYYYDMSTGAMQKGWSQINNKYYYFNEGTGVLVQEQSKIPPEMEFRHENGHWFWYEHGLKQGVPGDLLNIWDVANNIERGREIYDPASDAWYWLDASNGGARAESKEVWMPYIYSFEEKGSTNGKWVRFDDSGKMIHGWFSNNIGTYYYDLSNGAMYKGWNRIDNKDYHFDETTGIMIQNVPPKVTPQPTPQPTPVPVTNTYWRSANSDVFHYPWCASAEKP